MGQLGQAITSVLPSLVAGLTFGAVIVLLLSGATPTVSDRLPLLYRLIPLSLVELSHFVGSVVGAAMLLVARGLQRRLDSVWWMAVVLVGVGVIASVLKGLDFEEAAFLTLVLIALIASRRRFYRRGSLLHERYSAGWLSAIVMAVACSFWLGLFAYKHVEYRTDLWWQFESSRDVSRLLRASVGVVSVLLFFAVSRMTKREHGPRFGPPSEIDMAQVAEIVSRSARTSANLALLGNKQFLFSEDRSTLIMYGVERRSWIVMGDPVGPPAQWSELIWKFRELCDQYDGWPVFFQVEPDSLSIYIDQGLTLLKLGEEALVSVPEFTLEGSHRKSLRGDHSKLLKAGCTFEIVLASDVPALLPHFREISDA